MLVKCLINALFFVGLPIHELLATVYVVGSAG